MNNTYLAHHGVKGMKWGVRKSPSERASAKSLRYAKKAAKLQKKVAKLKKRELKNTKKELKAIYRGNIKGERTYKRRRVVASVKAAKKDAKAAKFTAKSQKMLKKSMQLKANEVDQQTKERGRASIASILGGPKPTSSTYKFSTSDASKAMRGKDKKEYDSIVEKVNSGKASEEDEFRMLELEEKHLEFG